MKSVTLDQEKVGQTAVSLVRVEGAWPPYHEVATRIGNRPWTVIDSNLVDEADARAIYEATVDRERERVKS